MKAETWCSPYWVDGKIYLGDDSGKMHSLRARQGEEDPCHESRHEARKMRATPVAVNGVLYVMTENPCKLWAIDQVRALRAQRTQCMGPHRTDRTQYAPWELHPPTHAGRSPGFKESSE